MNELAPSPSPSEPRRTAANERPTSHRQDFEALLRAELGTLAAAANRDPGDDPPPRVDTELSSKEPFATQVPRDLTGLCLSGGGIRSATFNLGVLQELHRMGVLGFFDYLSTVSGGGYIGGCWSRWLAARSQGDVAIFPANPTRSREVRHLREFSNFLSPRLGVADSETGAFALAVVAAAIPSLLATAALLIGLMWAYVGLVLGFAWWRDGDRWWISATLFVGAMVAFHGHLERLWRRGRKAERRDQRHGWMAVFTLIGAAVAAAALIGLLPFADSFEEVELALGVNGARPTSPFTLEPYALGIACWIALGVLLVGRWGLSLFASSKRASTSAAREPETVHALRTRRAALDRVAARFLLIGILWCAMTFAWQFGLWLAKADELTLSVGGHAGAAAATGGLFVWARKLFARTASEPQGTSMLRKLRPKLPQILAYVTVFLMVAGAARVVAGSWTEAGLSISITAVVVLATVLFFAPHEMGLHGTYRARIARTYLGAFVRRSHGAARPGENDDNSQTEERRDDDLALEDMPQRPLHLVCCAANDLAGDPLATLDRGARSAALSRHGIAVGDRWSPWGPYGDRAPSLASALTASAAAFNPCMGAKSTELGPAVTFLMAALNMRLGLWVHHPLHAESVVKLRGWRFYRELFGWTRVADDEAWLHLSDGGHFENLGLYELVRRRCRYVLVCDCGADPDCGFDDFGNAVRKIRQDFGVGIRIDLTPLRPDANGIARQHVAVGEIDYDDDCKGILVLIKPALTGDEPDDVQQYRTRNRAFPNESTGDQFYDDAQWESYRRLGEHSIEVAMRGVRLDRDSRALFDGLYWSWYPSPEGFGEDFLELTRRCYEIDDRVRAEAPSWFKRELFPELDDVAATRASTPTPKEREQVVGFLMLGMQLLEDVWVSGSLDQLHNHPLNLGWMNYFQRWTYAPSFRLWWPVLRSMWSPGVRAFVERHFHLDQHQARASTRTLLMAGAPESGLAYERWREEGKRVDDGPQWIEHRITMRNARDESADLQIGLARVEIQGSEARWNADDFYIAPGLWGSGLGSRFLEDLCNELAIERDIGTLRVSVPAVREANDSSRRRERVDLLQFYAAIGFKAVPGPGADTQLELAGSDLCVVMSRAISK